MKSIRNYSGFFFNPRLEQRSGSIQVHEKNISEPLYKRMDWLAISLFICLWGCLVFFVVSLLSGTYLVEVHNEVISPMNKTNIVPQKTAEMIKDFWKSGGQANAIILVVGFFIAP